MNRGKPGGDGAPPVHSKKIESKQQNESDISINVEVLSV